MPSGAGSHPTKCRQQGVVVLYVKFSTDASGDPTPNPTLGQGWSLAKTTTGTYRITLYDRYVSLDACHPSVHSKDGEFRGEWLADATNASTPYVDIRVYNAGVAADPISSAVHVTLALNTTAARSAP